MKKRVLIVVLTTLLILSFCIPVNAEAAIAGAYPRISELKYFNVNNTDVTNAYMQVTVQQLEDTFNAGFVALIHNNPVTFGDGYTPLLVTCRLVNQTNRPIYFDTPSFSILGLGNVSYRINGFDNITTECFLDMIDADSSKISMKAENKYMYGANTICVPPSSSLYAVSVIYTKYDEYVVDSTNPDIQNSNGVTVTGIILNYIACGYYDSWNYPDKPIDLSPIINAIESLDTNMQNNIDSIAEVLNLIRTDTQAALNYYQDIINALTYSGEEYSQSNSNLNYTQNLINQKLLGDVTIQLHRNVYTSYFIDNDVDYLPSSDTYYQNGTVCTHVRYVLYIRNDGDTLRCWNLTGLNLLPTNQKISVKYDIYSDILGQFNANGQYIAGKYIQGNYYYISNGVHTTIIDMYIYHDSKDTLGWNKTYSINFQGISHVTNYYSPRSEYEILRDIYLGVANTNGTDTASSSAGSLNNSVAGVHQQEEQFYAQNSQALESSGITHYSFDNDSASALNVARTLFERLWIALNPYTIVYTFSMLLTLALAIIRYTNSRKAKKE